MEFRCRLASPTGEIVEGLYTSENETRLRHELEEKGIIKDEGGFLWGLLGSTTTLAPGFDERLFKPMNKEVNTAIQVNGKIDEILPRRSVQSYSAAPLTYRWRRAGEAKIP